MFLLLALCFTPYSSVSIVDFKQVNVNAEHFTVSKSKAKIHSEHFETSKMELFVKIRNGWKKQKAPPSDAWQGSGYTTVKLAIFFRITKVVWNF